MKAKDIMLFCALVAMAATLGCTPSIVSTDAGVWYGGKLYAAAGSDITTVYDATLKAMEKLELEVTSKAKDVFYAKVTAKAVDGKVVIVRIKPENDSRTKFTIRVGPMGQRNRSEIIYNEIRANLPK